MIAALLGAGACSMAAVAGPSIAPASMPRISSVDERFQSYHVEMVEVTGGRFWKPYEPESGARRTRAPQTGGQPGSDVNNSQGDVSG